MTEPLLVSGMRQHPNGEVRHLPADGAGMTGTSTSGFLREYDEAIQAAKADAWDNGYVARLGDEPRYTPRSCWGNPYRTEGPGQ